MSDAAQVREEMDGDVLILTIDYPSRKNALGPGVRQALEEAIERAHEDKAVRAIVHHRRGRAPSAPAATSRT